MPSLLLCTGFEHGLTDLTSLAKGNAGNRFADGVNGGPAIVASTPRSGTYCLECSSAAATEGLQWNTNTFGASKTSLVVGFGLYIPTALPAADVTLTAVITTGSVDLELAFRNSDDRLVLTDHNGGNLVAGPVIAADTWYWVDVHLDVSAATYVADWQVDGAAQTQWSAGGGAAGSVTDLWLGWRFDAQTMTARYDDLVLSTTGADYPLGEHKVLVLTPDTGASTAQIGTGNATARFTGNATADATHNSANILAAINELPPLIGATATGLCQRTSGSGNACGVPMTTYTLDTGETISGLRVEVVGWAGSTTANNLGLRTHNGSTETILFAAADPNFDNNTTSPAWLCKMATAADFDTQAELDALVVRLGYSTDISPLPGAHAIYAELAVKESSGGGTVNLGEATETDTGHALSAAKTATLAEAAETDTGHPLTPAKAVPVGQSVEVDTGHTLTVAKTVQLGHAVETDTGLALVIPVDVALGRAAETGTGHPLSLAKVVTLGQSLETDTGHALVIPTGGELGQALEVDTGRALSFLKAASLGQVIETDAGLPLTPAKTVVLDGAVETDTALAVMPLKALTVGQSAETDTAGPLLVGKAAAVGYAVETDTALPLALVPERDITITAGPSHPDWSAGTEPQPAQAAAEGSWSARIEAQPNQAAASGGWSAGSLG